MPGGVNHVQGIGFAVELPWHANRLRLDGDAALTFDVHAVQVLRAHRAIVDDAG